jgi:hypothetical protein
MIILDTHWPMLSYRVVYFPTPQMLDLMLSDLRPNQLIRIRQTRAAFEYHPYLVRRSAFRAICIDLTNSLDSLQRRMDATCRRWLRKAANVRHQIDIRVNDQATYHDFIRLYNSFAARHRHSGPISDKALARLRRVSDLFVAYYQGRPACGHLWLRDEVCSRTRLIFSASSRLEGRQEANLSSLVNRYLHWAEIEKYRAEGFDLYDMGGFENEADLSHSLTRFKLSLGGFLLTENNFCFATGFARLAYRIFDGLPGLLPRLRGRLPA